RMLYAILPMHRRVNMRKLYVVLSILFAASGLALVGIGFLLALPPASGPTEAKGSSPAVPVVDKPAVAAALEGDIVAVLSSAAVDLNSRDAMIGSEDEI